MKTLENRFEFVRVHDDELERDPDGQRRVYQPCPLCGQEMHVSSIRCDCCGCSVAWGCDPNDTGGHNDGDETTKSRRQEEHEMPLHEIREQYEKFERRYGADAPVAMLRWLRRADHSLDERCITLADTTAQLLVKRCVAVFEAELADGDAVRAYQSAADKLRGALGLAFVVSAFAPTIAEA